MKLLFVINNIQEAYYEYEIQEVCQQLKAFC